VNPSIRNMFVYDVDGEGLTIIHYGEELPDGLFVVSVGDKLYPAMFFLIQKAMHEASGHTMICELDNELGQVWFVQIGAGDFTQLGNAMKFAVQNDIARRVFNDILNGG